jgi:uncharacterized protein YkwD
MQILPGERGRSPLLATVIVIAAVLAGVQPAGAAEPGSSGVLLRLVNTVRAQHGAPPLRPDRQIARAAHDHSRDMVAQRYFAHVSRAGEGPIDRIAQTGWMRGRGRWRVGEDLAWGRGRAAAPAAIVAAWLASPTHRRVLLRRAYRVVGIGIVRGTPVDGPDRGVTYTADLGS